MQEAKPHRPRLTSSNWTGSTTAELTTVRAGECSLCEEKGETIKWPGGYLCDNCSHEAEKLTKMQRVPPPHIQDMIRSQGTDEQVEALDAKLKAAGIEPGGTSTKLATEYFMNLPTPKAEGPEDLRSAAHQFFANKMQRGKRSRPESVTYKLTKSLLWDAYCAIVWEESKVDLIQRAREKKSTLDGNASVVMRNFAYWLIGQPNPDGEGFDPEKGIIFWGDLGVGKSTISRAGQQVLAFYRQRLGWEANAYRCTHMDSVFLETIATQKLDDIGAMRTGNLCIDELKEKHFSYKHYGNDIPLINTVLLARHEEWKWNGARTIITTNIAKPRMITGPGSVFQDDRLESRIEQEYQFVELRGSNKRKPAARL